MLPMTLRLRLALVYGTLASVALALALVAAYGFYERGAYRNSDGVLKLFTTQAVGVMLLGKGIDPLSVPPPGIPVFLRSFDANGRSPRGAPDAPFLEPQQGLEDSSSAHLGWISLLPTIGTNPVDYSGYSLLNQNGERWRFLTIRTSDGYMQAITPLGSLDRAIGQIRRNYTVFGGLGALLVFILGYLISGPALRPLNSLMLGAQTVAGSSDPRFRLSKTRGNDELMRLGETFNAMLGSLETGAATREAALQSEREARVAAESAVSALEISEERFRRVVESRVVGVMIARRDGTISYANEALLKMLGYESLVGKTWAALTPPEFAARDETATQELMTSKMIAPFEKQYLRADGSRIPVLIGATMLEGENSEVAAFILDITEQHRAEESLRASEAQGRALSEAQRRFVADAAHELRAPLTAIQGNLELMERYPNMPETDRAEAVREAARESRRLARLAQDMLSLARGDAGLNLALHPLRWHELLSEVWRDARHLAHGQRMELGRLEACVVNGHPDRLRQLALVLIDNALKYTPESGTVSLELNVSDGLALLRVTDTGVGIPADQLARVFERFYRAEESRSRETGGTGLGLSIARWIAEQHGGEVWLESTVGVGTTAIVKLPVLPESAITEG
jgi:PAS domain S-box-containing protein